MSRSPDSRAFAVLFVFATLAAAFASPLAAQRSDRDSAAVLVKAGLHREALPFLERLATPDSKDVWVFEELGWILVETSAAPTDSTERRAIRVRARAALQQAVTLGSRSEQTRAMLAAVPPDGGGERTFSQNKDVESAMQDAERNYSRRNFRAALELYQRALFLDPAQYEAALYSGDAYMQLKDYDSAYDAYRRATQIDPDKETAWRYWSDVLQKHGKLDEAGRMAIEAMIAEPYSRLARAGIANWARAARKNLAFPPVDLAPADSSAKMVRVRAAYDSVRASWKGRPRAVLAGRTAPSLGATLAAAVGVPAQAELEALREAWRLSENDPRLARVKRMDDDGVLEAFVFVVRADPSIAADYPVYRDAHRDAIRRFWTDWVFGTYAVGAPYP